MELVILLPIIIGIVSSLWLRRQARIAELVARLRESDHAIRRLRVYARPLPGTLPATDIEHTLTVNEAVLRAYGSGQPEES